MDRNKLLTFFIAWTAMFLLFQTLFFRQPPQPAPGGGAGGDDIAAVVDEDLIAENAESDPVANAEASDDPEVSDVLEQRPSKSRLISMGSMDAASGHHLLVTLNTRGGGIERIEVTARDEDGGLKYRRVDVKHGYLGYLGSRDPILGGISQSDVPRGGLDDLADVETASNGNAADAIDGSVAGDETGVANPAGAGAEVRTVGDGTPADRAGVKVGDVLRQIDGVAVRDEDSIEATLLDTRPGDSVKLSLLRGGKPITLTATLTEHPLDLVRLATTGGVDQVKGNLSRLSSLMTLATAGRRSIPVGRNRINGVTDPASTHWTVSENSPIASNAASGGDAVSGDDSASGNPASGETAVTLSLPMTASELGLGGSGVVELQRTYVLRPGSYLLDLDLAITNRSADPTELAYRLEGPNGLTLEGWWYSTKITPNFMGGAAARDLIYRMSNDSRRLLSGFSLLKRAKNDTANPRETIFAAADAAQAPDLLYAGVDTQYFLVSYLPKKGEPSLNQFQRFAAGVFSDPAKVPKHQERAANTSFFLDSGVAKLGPGDRVEHHIAMYAGPKDPDVLDAYGLGDAVYYGWFGPFSILLAGLLHTFAGMGSYALAIILLTVMVRGMLFPLSRKAAVNAQRMQELAPEMKKIAEKYKEDLQGRMQAQQALQKKAGFNPLSGCLPMFLQLPIFIGLYRALSVDIELRQQPLIPGLDWASNLAGPDMLSYWGDWMPDYLAGRGTGWLGPYFNLLPILVVGLFLTQQKLFMPPATDEQTRMTQRVMTVMTLFMALFFFRVPAGLCIYFITSSLWGICERILVKKTLPPKNESPLVTEGGPESAKPKSSSSIAQRLRDQARKPEPEFKRPNQRKRPKKAKR